MSPTIPRSSSTDNRGEAATDQPGAERPRIEDAGVFLPQRSSIVAAGLLLAMTGLGPTARAVPPPNTPPLLYVRLDGPKGTKITFYPTPATARTFPAPAIVGLRPGYIYRVKVSGFPDNPKRALYPSLEVRNTLCLPPVYRLDAHPAPLGFTLGDVARVQAGAMLTKVIVLEDPETAIPLPSTAHEPLEVEVRPGPDPLEEARLHGRPLLVMRLGERDLTEAELACRAIPGTIRLPGERYLAPPAAPPCLSYGCLPLVDPDWGVKHGEEECLRDGGDIGPTAGLDRNGQLHGLDPSDTVAVYTDRRGLRHVIPSNRVCLCVPRYIVLLASTLPSGYQVGLGVGDARNIVEQVRLQSLFPSRTAAQDERLLAYHARLRSAGSIATEVLQRIDYLAVLQGYQLDIGTGAFLGTEGMLKLSSEQRTRLKQQMEFAKQFEQPLRPSGTEQTFTGPAVFARVEGSNVVERLQETRDITTSCDEKPEPPDRLLRLYKWADRRTGQVGDVVTFYLKFINLGGQPMTDVAVSDSLTGRLEYIPGSAKSSRDSVFTMQENRAGSVVLHWEVRGTLLPNQNGVVSFQAKIR